MPLLSLALLRIHPDGATEPLLGYTLELGTTLPGRCARPLVPGAAGALLAEFRADATAFVEITAPPLSGAERCLTLQPHRPVRVRVHPGQRIGAILAPVASVTPFRVRPGAVPHKTGMAVASAG